ncbi:histidine phosphatase family protein [Poseidonocella sp. HB161398]|uniref:histidine phosphatase family protein n=1 Tax=Poseidonocella sp. HB161398 TaxID=2320855 RepID=UPI001109AE94|nr:histidine phosphatase family protein [Poseidonocella sp. HB161398]
MSRLIFITHPEVVLDPETPVERWHLSEAGIARMRAFARGPEAAAIGTVWSSAETKAIEAAGLLAAARGCGIAVDPRLGENDRSATGFLPPAEFERTADAFFARPEDSIRGWERASDAQARILAAVTAIAARPHAGDLAIVAHGAVGALLLCALRRQAISRSMDQPFQGHFWTATLPDLVPLSGWIPVAPRG